MNNYSIYHDIATRTNGDIYIGVVGPVRTGKSTFIKNFMDIAVLPNIKDEFKARRAQDELPQSSNGKTIMTTEPKFVPNEAVEVMIDNVKFNMRMIDCVGYLVKNAVGHLEGDVPRMVSTPWFENQIPFEEAAELGTKKVIEEHSTIGILVTTDGSVTELDRDDYIDAEERVAKELKAQNKPFVILLNTNNPNSNEANVLCKELENKYDAPVIAINCLRLSEEDINNILGKVLYEFPVNEIDINLPKWVENLNCEHWLRKNILTLVKTKFTNIQNLRQIKHVLNEIGNEEIVDKLNLNTIELGNGKALVDVMLDNSLFYKILTEISGFNVEEEGDLFSIVTSLAQSKKSYDKIAAALNDVERKGYGIVTPNMEDLTLEEPEIVKQGSKFGVKLRAKAPSLHIPDSKRNLEFKRKLSQITGPNEQRAEYWMYYEIDVDIAA